MSDLKDAGMSDRDKLIAEASGWNAMIGNPLARIHMTNAECAVASKAIETALALVAELVRDTPREVSTVAELDALPIQSVVMDGDEQIWRKSNDLWDCLDLNGEQPREESKTVLWQSREPSATVLFTPTSKETEGAAEIPLEGGTP